jgi:hypothetical protein
MYKTISNKIIRSLNMGYDPSEVIKNEDEEISIKEWIKKYRSIIPARYIILIFVREEFMSEKDLRTFAIWCACRALKLVENPDERVVKACQIVEKFINGEATREELHTASNAVYATLSTHTAYTGRDIQAVGTTRGAYYAVYYASEAADTTDTADYALSAVYYASEAAYYAHADTYNAAQVDKLLTYFE